MILHNGWPAKLVYEQRHVHTSEGLLRPTHTLITIIIQSPTSKHYAVESNQDHQYTSHHNVHVLLGIAQQVDVPA